MKDRTIATAAAIIAAVALPQLLHGVGALLGIGAGPAQALLPMHIPVILVGLLAGPTVGIITGLASPLLAFAISGMPLAAMLPFMMLELAAYGLVAGLLVRVKMHVILKVIAVQIAGRLVRLAAVWFALTFLGAKAPSLVSVWDATVAGLPGILLAWIVIPPIFFWLRKRGLAK